MNLLQLAHENGVHFVRERGAGWGGAVEDEIVRQHRQFNGHESEQTPGDSEGQGSLACCHPWGHKESKMT